jgi:hypothetical protein
MSVALVVPLQVEATVAVTLTFCVFVPAIAADAITPAAVPNASDLATQVLFTHLSL